MHGDAMNAVSDLGALIWNVLRVQSAIDWLPCPAGVVCTEGARRRNGDKHPLRILSVQENCVETHPSGARLPVRPGAVAAQAREFLPRFSAVGRVEQSRVLDARVHCFRVRQRRFEMPGPLEFPGMWRPVIPLMGPGHSLIFKFVPNGLPGLAAVI